MESSYERYSGHSWSSRSSNCCGFRIALFLCRLCRIHRCRQSSLCFVFCFARACGGGRGSEQRAWEDSDGNPQKKEELEGKQEGKGFGNKEKIYQNIKASLSLSSLSSQWNSAQVKLYRVVTLPAQPTANEEKRKRIKKDREENAVSVVSPLCRPRIWAAVSSVRLSYGGALRSFFLRAR